MSMKYTRMSGLGVLFGLACGLTTTPAHALTWKGHTWNVTNGGMAGVCQGHPNNVSVDSNGYLHLQITNDAGTWTAAELFTNDELGTGTFQWQVDGAIDKFAPWIVLGLFPYGPAAGIGTDGTNEIDIEYSVWGHAGGPNGDWTDYPASGKTIGELAYTFDLGGSTLSTSRFVWGKTSIESFLMGGIATIDSTAGLIKSWTYSPPNPAVNIPQQALPLGMNLWCFQAPPAGAENVEVVIRDFQMVPEGAGSDDGGVDSGGEGSSDVSDGSSASGMASGSGSGDSGIGGSGIGGSGDTADSGTAGGSGSSGTVVGSASNAASGIGAGGSGSSTGSSSATTSGGIEAGGRATGGSAGSGGMSSGNSVAPHEAPAPAPGCSCSTVGDGPPDSSFPALGIASALAALAIARARTTSLRGAVARNAGAETHHAGRTVECARLP
jgi:hypothetical protein